LSGGNLQDIHPLRFREAGEDSWRREWLDLLGQADCAWVRSVRRHGLTREEEPSKVVEMQLGKAILLAMLAAALVGYALDCGPMVTAEQAMQCCQSMPCSSPGHEGEDCCQTMSAGHAPFLQPASAQTGTLESLAVAVVPTAPLPPDAVLLARVAVSSHTPPILGAVAAPTLRI